METNYSKYVKQLSKIADLEHSMAVLHWDKEVNLPKNGAAMRGQQLATLAGITHELSVDDNFGNLLQELTQNGEELSFKEKRNVEITFENYNKEKKLSKEFVEKRSLITTNCYQAWLDARAANDYAVFEPALNEMVELKKEETRLLGFKEHPYDILMDEFEKGATVKQFDKLFEDVKTKLVTFVKKLNEKPQVEDAFLRLKFDKDKQWNYGLELLQTMGYDFDAGRQDLSPHPFTISFGAEDVRVTTRIDEHNFANMAWSCIHEGGHGLYEQGLPSSEYGLPSGKYLTLGIHESQSRLWENNVGRSLSFWKGQYENLQNTFPEQLSKVSLKEFYKAINKVEPSLIRTESDELHYHLHILIRYELEKALIEGSLSTKDLKSAWNAKYKDYLGLEIRDDNHGILQDIHWSHGSLGYFPTYSLGSFYAAQFFHIIKKDTPNIIDQIESGDTSAVLSWLRTNIHAYGQTYNVDDLCKKTTGETLDFTFFMNYIEDKYSKIYDL